MQRTHRKLYAAAISLIQKVRLIRVKNKHKTDFTQTGLEFELMWECSNLCCTAARVGYLKTVKILLPYVYIDHVDGLGHTAIMHAIINKHINVARLIVSHMDKHDISETKLLIQAGRVGFTEGIALLLPYINPDKTDSWEMTALMYASANGHYDAVRILSRYSRVTYVNTMKMSALQLAASGGHIEIITVLIEHSSQACINMALRATMDNAACTQELLKGIDQGSISSELVHMGSIALQTGVLESIRVGLLYYIHSVTPTTRIITDIFIPSFDVTLGCLMRDISNMILHHIDINTCVLVYISRYMPVDMGNIISQFLMPSPLFIIDSRLKLYRKTHVLDLE
jgi:hypothetical protein